MQIGKVLLLATLIQKHHNVTTYKPSSFILLTQPESKVLKVINSLAEKSHRRGGFFAALTVQHNLYLADNLQRFVCCLLDIIGQRQCYAHTPFALHFRLGKNAQLGIWLG